jgi:hypothetical protein
VADTDSGGTFGAGKLAKIVTTAKVAGKKAALPILKGAIRDEMVRLLNEEDPETLRQYIDVGYPMVRNDLPDGYKSALSSAGPQFEDDIIALVNPETIMGWLAAPEEWMGDDAGPEDIAQVRRVGEILQTHPGGEEWLSQQVLALYEVCNIDISQE